MRQAKGPDEFEVFNRKLRRIFIWTHRAGASRKVKRRANRRERRAARTLDSDGER